MAKTVSVETMRRSDAWTIEHETDSLELMKRAGRSIFEAAEWKAPVGIVCGKGNNAGDGFVAALFMHYADIECDIILISDSFSEDGRHYYDICRDKGIRALRYADGMDLSRYGSICDCIFGTGFSCEPAGVYADIIDAVNCSGAYVVSADINSGLNGDTGMGTKYIISDLTVSIGEYKPGHFLGFAYGAMKDRVNADIGIKIQGEYIDINEPDLVVLVDLNTGKEVHLRDAGGFAAMNEAFEGLNYFERTERYAEEYVDPEDRNIFRECMQLQNIRSSIEAGKVCSLRYHVILEGEKRTVETGYIPYRAGISGSHLAVKTVRRI